MTSNRWANVLVVLSVGLCACSGERSKPPAAGQDSAARTPAGTNRIAIAMIAKSSTNPVFLAARTGAEATAKELSEKNGIQVEVRWLTPPQEDGQVQAQRIAQCHQRRGGSRRGGHDVRQRRTAVEAVRVLRG